MSILIKRAKPVIEKKNKKLEYLWQENDSGYRVDYPEESYGELRQRDGKWTFELSLNNRNDLSMGSRETLEDAFKELDRQLYIQDRQLWMKTRCGMVLSKFASDLDTLFD